MRQKFSRLELLFQRRQVGAKFSLDGIRQLCEAIGNPQKDLRFIHIAGTNGKGSVAAMCASIFRECGFKTGLYTSPHLIRYHERFQINGKEIQDQELEIWLEKIIKIHPAATFFEISTALAFGWFREKGVQMVVLETGLGGRLDATNIVTPLVSIITSIGLDHMQFLGNTLAEIALEKAGIIKSSIPVITSFQSEEVMTVLMNKAKEQNAPFHVIKKSDLDEFRPPLSGQHQRENTVLAVAAVRLIKPEMSRDVINRGLNNTKWPGRCQLVERGNGLPPVLLDGAHNPMGAHVLVKEVERLWGRGNSILIFGALADKAIAEMGQIYKDLAYEVFLTPVSSDRSANVTELFQHFLPGRTFSSLKTALSVADTMQRPIIITGSLFLVGEALLLLSGNHQALHPNERLLLHTYSC